MCLCKLLLLSTTIAVSLGAAFAENPLPTDAVKFEFPEPELGSFKADSNGSPINMGRKNIVINRAIFNEVDTCNALTSVLHDWLTVPQRKKSAFDYSRTFDPLSGKRTEALQNPLVLIDERYLPEGCRPAISQVSIEFFDIRKRLPGPRDIHLRIDSIKLLTERQAEIEFVNSGGSMGGGMWVSYKIERKGMEWLPKLQSADDP